MNDPLAFYLKQMTQTKTDWSEEELVDLIKNVSLAMGVDQTTLEGTARVRTWVYAVLGQAAYGRKIRSLCTVYDDPCDLCGLGHANEMVHVFEQLATKTALK